MTGYSSIRLLPVVLFAFFMLHGCRETGSISGVVCDGSGPLAGATVRVQAADNATLSDSDGAFTLTGLEVGVPVTINAWKEGYYCGLVEHVTPPGRGVRITLEQYQTDDNPEYEWLSPAGTDGCSACHPQITDIWQENAHADSAVNERFLTMYNGTDIYGNKSPLTRYIDRKDYGRAPLPPDPNLPYYGPGYKLDFPDTMGNCACCHNPGAAIDDPYGTDPNEVSGADVYGIHCDYCHKVAGVFVDNATGLPQDNMPGVLSTDIRRPFTDESGHGQLFFGPFDDPHAAEGDSYLPAMQESLFCAPCHFGRFWDTLIYNSYGEWLESPYSDPETGKTCQHCHMPAPTEYDGDVLTNIAPENGGVERDPLTIRAHLQLGALDEAFLRDALTMTVATERRDEAVTVTVSITNDNTGHHIPTDSPLRHLILLVRALDHDGNDLELADGSVVPEWCGDDETADGQYAGWPGKAFAKILEELWTGISPTGAYWSHTRLVSDNRIAALETDTSGYIFNSPDSETVYVDVKLIFRRAFIELSEQKGWELQDIVMAHEKSVVE